LLWELGGRKDIPEVGGRILFEKRRLLTERNTSSVVIDGLRDEAGKEDIAVASLYYSSLAQEEQTIINMLGAILKQLVGRGHIPWYLREAFREAKTELGTRRPQLSDLVRMLRLTIASIPRVFICIYGLDECLPNRLPELLGPLGDIVRELPRTRILLTGRSHIEKDIYRYFAKAVVIPIGPNADGIKNFLEPGSDRGTKPDAMNDCSQSYTSVKTIMMERVSDMCVRVFGTPARAALLIAANGHLIAAFFVCVLAFLAYVFSSSLSKIFSFHK